MTQEDRIDELIEIVADLWSKLPNDTRELHEVLGMTWEEYAVWANPDANPLVMMEA